MRSSRSGSRRHAVRARPAAISHGAGRLREEPAVQRREAAARRARVPAVGLAPRGAGRRVRAPGDAGAGRGRARRRLGRPDHRDPARCASRILNGGGHDRRHDRHRNPGCRGHRRAGDRGARARARRRARGRDRRSRSRAGAALADRLEVPESGDYQSVLDNPDIDLVYLPLPSTVQAHWAVRALQAGKNVLCEKPLSANGTPRRGSPRQRMLRAGAPRGVPLPPARLHPSAAGGARLGGPGADPARRVRLQHPHFVVQPGNIRLDGDLGGGSFMDVGCYVVDLMRAAWGEPTVVSAEAVLSADDPRIDLQTDAVLVLPGGIPALRPLIVHRRRPGEHVAAGHRGRGEPGGDECHRSPVGRGDACHRGRSGADRGEGCRWGVQLHSGHRAPSARDAVVDERNARFLSDCLSARL